MTPEEMRKVIDQYFIDGDDSYECRVQTNDMYQGEKEELLCSVSSYQINIEPPGDIFIHLYVHPIEDLDYCPVISREALFNKGEFYLGLWIDEVGDGSYITAKNTVDRWLAGEVGGNEDGQYVKLSEKTLNFLYALVGYYYAVMKRK